MSLSVPFGTVEGRHRPDDARYLTTRRDAPPPVVVKATTVDLPSVAMAGASP